MTATVYTRPARSLGDRYAEISVILVTLLALALGWALKSAVEARSVPFEAAGIRARRLEAGCAAPAARPSCCG